MCADTDKLLCVFVHYWFKLCYEIRDILSQRDTQTLAQALLHKVQKICISCFNAPCGFVSMPKTIVIYLFLIIFLWIIPKKCVCSFFSTKLLIRDNLKIEWEEIQFWTATPYRIITELNMLPFSPLITHTHTHTCLLCIYMCQSCWHLHFKYIQFFIAIGTLSPTASE